MSWTGEGDYLVIIGWRTGETSVTSFPTIDEALEEYEEFSNADRVTIAKDLHPHVTVEEWSESG